MAIKIENQEKILFVIYGVVFAYALIIQFTKIALPLATVVIPVALCLLVIFILHMINLLFRDKK